MGRADVPSPLARSDMGIYELGQGLDRITAMPGDKDQTQNKNSSAGFSFDLWLTGEMYS